MISMYIYNENYDNKKELWVVFFNVLEVLVILVPILMAVAFVTIAERKGYGGYAT